MKTLLLVVALLLSACQQPQPAPENSFQSCMRECRGADVMDCSGPKDSKDPGAILEAQVECANRYTWLCVTTCGGHR
jgi:hypothetical protein